METLDGDSTPLYSQMSSKYVEADIVQFVPFNQFKQDPQMLARATLREIPGQLLNWMRKKGFKPNNIAADAASVLVRADANIEEEKKEEEEV